MGAGVVPSVVSITPAMWATEMSRETAVGHVNAGIDPSIAALRAVVVLSLPAGDGIYVDTIRCFDVGRAHCRDRDPVGRRVESRGHTMRVVAYHSAGLTAAARSLTGDHG